MAEGYRRIFWGILVATFNISVGPLRILPAFVGWLMVMSGLSRFEESLEEQEYAVIRKKSLVLVLLSLGGAILSLAGYGELGHQPILLFLPLIVMIAELVVFHGILDLSVEVLKRDQYLEQAEVLIVKDRTYLVLIGLSLVFLVISLTFGHRAASIIAAILGIGSRIYLLVTMSYLRKVSEGQETLERHVAQGRTK